MIRLGIVGAESSHAFHVGAICNVSKKVPMRVTHIWGETREFAEATAGKASIPNIVDHWEEMAGQVDGVMIDHRDGGLHYEVARYFIERGLPTFIDKPMTADLAQAIGLLALAEAKGTPVCTFGIIPLQRRFRAFRRRLAAAGEIRALDTAGPADIDGPHGGIFFYGIHQVEAIVELMGTRACAARLIRKGNDGLGTIFFPDEQVATVDFQSEGGSFRWEARIGEDVFKMEHQMDTEPFLPAARAIHRLIRQGEVPWSRARMLAPIAILQALQRSLKSGQIEAVEPFG